MGGQMVSSPVGEIRAGPHISRGGRSGQRNLTQAVPIQREYIYIVGESTAGNNYRHSREAADTDYEVGGIEYVQHHANAHINPEIGSYVRGRDRLLYKRVHENDRTGQEIPHSKRTVNNIFCPQALQAVAPVAAAGGQSGLQEAKEQRDHRTEGPLKHPGTSGGGTAMEQQSNSSQTKAKETTKPSPRKRSRTRAITSDMAKGRCCGVSATQNKTARVAPLKGFFTTKQEIGYWSVGQSWWMA
ncbi:uncharacterized protein LOC128655343 [Bombina bombina]|uniref:uncharacterized protein LOC128655343 n=1 Tax=Bombina bombina TaxID=8345 RepID=UPI00235A60D3|nr:uncharacterized protein LOC128655343 [Bombina bombina]